MAVIEFFGVRAELKGGEWTSDEKLFGLEASWLIEAFPLPGDGFQYYPYRDFAWVNYLAEQFPRDVVVIENKTAPFDPNVIY